MDIKPSNILISSSGTYKLSDFGNVCRADGSLELVEGDEIYMSREILQGVYKSKNPEITNLRAADIFSFGLSMYVRITYIYHIYYLEHMRTLISVCIVKY